jgi:hypothetical protein
LQGLDRAFLTRPGRNALAHAEKLARAVSASSVRGPRGMCGSPPRGWPPSAARGSCSIRRGGHSRSADRSPPRGRWLVSVAGLPRRSFAPISALIVNIGIRLFATSRFGTREPTPGSLPCYPPDRPIRPRDRRKYAPVRSGWKAAGKYLFYKVFSENPESDLSAESMIHPVSLLLQGSAKSPETFACQRWRSAAVPPTRFASSMGRP